MKMWWINTRVPQLLTELYSSATNFKISEQWFRRSQRWHSISLPVTTHASQKDPASLCNALRGVHTNIVETRKSGSSTLADIANIDQTPLLFILDDHRTYDHTGVQEVWCASGPSGLDMRQCTVQLTAFTGSASRVRLRIAKQEHDGWDKRALVVFQEMHGVMNL